LLSADQLTGGIILLSADQLTGGIADFEHFTDTNSNYNFHYYSIP
jgi:hypothetical protein